jgi:hypothetical protein
MLREHAAPCRRNMSTRFERQGEGTYKPALSAARRKAVLFIWKFSLVHEGRRFSFPVYFGFVAIFHWR